MKILIEKLDYELYKTLFLDGDLEKLRTLWKNICENTVFLSEGMQIDNIDKGMCSTFRAPMICFMMLRFPDSVPARLYEKLVDLVIRRKDIANSIEFNGSYLDFLSLVLLNLNLKLADYQKDMIINLVADSYGIEEDKRYVHYEELLDMESPIVHKMVSGDIEVTVSEYEYELFAQGEVKKPGIIRKYKEKDNYRANILTNPNFSELEKAYVEKHILQDEEEFKHFMNYYVALLASKNGLGKDFTGDYVQSLSVDEIKELYASNLELCGEIVFIKRLLDKHYKGVSKLVRSVN